VLSFQKDMDTGGFFVALLKKVKPLSRNATEQMDKLAKESRNGEDVETCFEDGGAEKKVATDSKEDKDATTTQSSGLDGKSDTKPVQKAPLGKVGHFHKQNKKSDLSNEDFIPIDDSIWPPIIEEYGLTDHFPKDQFMVRRSSEAKILHFISKSIKEKLLDNGIQDRVTVINSGLKGFERCSLKKMKSYRLAQEGIQYVAPYMTKRLLTANMDDFAACLQKGLTPFNAFSESFQKGLEQLTPGSFLVSLEGHEKDVSNKMYLVMWRRNDCVDCFVANIEKDGILMKMRALGYVPPARNEGKAGNFAEKVATPAVAGHAVEERGENGKSGDTG